MPTQRLPLHEMRAEDGLTYQLWRGPAVSDEEARKCLLDAHETINSEFRAGSYPSDVTMTPPATARIGAYLLGADPRQGTEPKNPRGWNVHEGCLLGP